MPPAKRPAGDDVVSAVLISPDEFRVMLDVFEKHVAELDEAQCATFCWDPMDVPRSFRNAKILEVIVATEKPTAGAKGGGAEGKPS